MSAAQRRRLRRKKKFVRNFKRTLTNIILAPARMPRISGDKLDRLMHGCEIIAIAFVAVLMLHMAVPTIIGTLPVVVIGVAFAFFLFMIGLSDYQEKLVQYDLYGFKI